MQVTVDYHIKSCTVSVVLQKTSKRKTKQNHDRQDVKDLIFKIKYKNKEKQHVIRPALEYRERERKKNDPQKS